MSYLVKHRGRRRRLGLVSPADLDPNFYSADYIAAYTKQWNADQATAAAASSGSNTTTTSTATAQQAGGAACPQGWQVGYAANMQVCTPPPSAASAGSGSTAAPAGVLDGVIAAAKNIPLWGWAAIAAGAYFIFGSSDAPRGRYA